MPLKRHERALRKQAAEAKEGLWSAQLEIIHRLASAAEFRDHETGEHIARMAVYAGKLALAAERRDGYLIQLAAPMHDIGKVAVPNGILFKPRKLTVAEFEVIKAHSRVGFEILDGSGFELLQLAAEIAFTHHEKWDGRGYPRAIGRRAIPASGRICAIADAWDAITSERPYKRAVETEQAIELMREARGTHFDPELLDLWIGLVEHNEI